VNYTANQCHGTVCTDIWPRNCTKKPVVERDGKWYCKIHDPEYVEARRAKQSAEADARWKARCHHFALHDAKLKAMVGLTMEEAQALTPALARAAPKLHEATKIALDLVKVVLYDHPDDDIAQTQKQIIEQALAKAEGKEAK